MSNREAMLLEVIRIVRCHPDFDHGGPMAEMMDQALAGVEHPTVLVALSNLALGRKPPETPRPEDGGITQALVEMARANAIEECARVAESEAAACQLGSPADKNCWPAALQACATKIRAIDAATPPQEGCAK